MTPVPQGVQEALKALRCNGFQAYPVGGCVRDMLLGRVPGDWDITTSATPEQVQGIFPKTVPTGIQHGTITVLLCQESMEITTFRADGDYSDGRHPDAVRFGVSLQEDLARRDFTINAMALGENGEILDFFGGKEDLERKLIRAVGEPERRFTEDALRMFRAVRFSAQLGFEIEENTAKAAQKLAQRASLLAGERIKVEVEKTLLSPHPEEARLFLKWGLLEVEKGGEKGSNGKWDRLDWGSLRCANSTPEARWRAFCVLTGFDITSLPVERRLRTAVLHPEREVINTLALSGGELVEMGFRGERAGQVQLLLARHVMAHPEDNTRQKLAALAKDLLP